MGLLYISLFNVYLALIAHKKKKKKKSEMELGLLFPGHGSHVALPSMSAHVPSALK